MEASYTKLRDGSWGVRASASVSPGDAVRVIKRDGSAKNETVGERVWAGADTRTGERIALFRLGSATRPRPSRSTD